MTLEEALEYLQTTSWKLMSEDFPYPLSPRQVYNMIEDVDSSRLLRDVVIVLEGKPGIYLASGSSIGPMLYELVEDESENDNEEDEDNTEKDSDNKPGYIRDILDIIDQLPPEQASKIINKMFSDDINDFE